MIGVSSSEPNRELQRVSDGRVEWHRRREATSGKEMGKRLYRRIVWIVVLVENRVSRGKKGTFRGSSRCKILTMVLVMSTDVNASYSSREAWRKSTKLLSGSLFANFSSSAFLRDEIDG